MLKVSFDIYSIISYHTPILNVGVGMKMVILTGLFVLSLLGCNDKKSTVELPNGLAWEMTPELDNCKQIAMFKTKDMA